jgi:Icc protein
VKDYDMVDLPGRLRFVHFTDTHIMAGGPWQPRAGNFEFDTAASLRRVVSAITALDPAPAFAVLGGDLASPDQLRDAPAATADEYEPSYRLLRDLLKPLPCPAYYVTGNHDHRVALARVFGSNGAADAPRHESFDHGDYHFTTLDSQKRGHVSGRLAESELAWLEADLTAHRARPTIVFVHHHPWPLGIRWLDDLMLENGEELTTCLLRHPQVSWLICGHVHLDQVMQRERLTVLTTPSTCVRFSKLSQDPAMLPGPPAFRIVDLVGRTLSTRVVHLHGDAHA